MTLLRANRSFERPRRRALGGELEAHRTAPGASTNSTKDTLEV